MGLGFCFILFFPKSSFVVSALSWKFNAASCNSEIQHWVLTLSSEATHKLLKGTRCSTLARKRDTKKRL